MIIRVNWTLVSLLRSSHRTNAKRLWLTVRMKVRCSALGTCCGVLVSFFFLQFFSFLRKTIYCLILPSKKCDVSSLLVSQDTVYIGCVLFFHLSCWFSYLHSLFIVIRVKDEREKFFSLTPKANWINRVVFIVVVPFIFMFVDGYQCAFFYCLLNKHDALISTSSLQTMAE